MANTTPKRRAGHETPQSAAATSKRVRRGASGLEELFACDSDFWVADVVGPDRRAFWDGWFAQADAASPQVQLTALGWCLQAIAKRDFDAAADLLTRCAAAGIAVARDVMRQAAADDLAALLANSKCSLDRAEPWLALCARARPPVALLQADDDEKLPEPFLLVDAGDERGYALVERTGYKPDEFAVADAACRRDWQALRVLIDLFARAHPFSDRFDFGPVNDSCTVLGSYREIWARQLAKHPALRDRLELLQGYDNWFGGPVAYKDDGVVGFPPDLLMPLVRFLHRAPYPLRRVFRRFVFDAQLKHLCATDWRAFRAWTHSQLLTDGGHACSVCRPGLSDASKRAAEANRIGWLDVLPGALTPVDAERGEARLVALLIWTAVIYEHGLDFCLGALLRATFGKSMPPKIDEAARKALGVQLLRLRAIPTPPAPPATHLADAAVEIGWLDRRARYGSGATWDASSAAAAAAAPTFADHFLRLYVCRDATLLDALRLLERVLVVVY